MAINLLPGIATLACTVSVGRLDSWLSPKVLEIKIFFTWNLLAQTISFIDYYFKRYDGQVLFFKWNYIFFKR